MTGRGAAARGAWPLAALFALCACAPAPPPPAPAAPAPSTAAPSVAVSEPPRADVLPSASAPVAAVAPEPSSGAPTAEPAPPDAPALVAAKHDKKAEEASDEPDEKAEVDPKNKAKPRLASRHLTASARALFRAVREDKPDVAKDFFFPREPFLPLKDIKQPGKYWDQLFRVYEKDIHELHNKRSKDWEDAEFVSFELGSTPTWVKPGEEANKIGYYRTFNGKLRYKARGKERVLEVKTIISWNHRWFITHLLPFKKK